MPFQPLSTEAEKYWHNFAIRSVTIICNVSIVLGLALFSLFSLNYYFQILNSIFKILRDFQNICA